MILIKRWNQMFSIIPRYLLILSLLFGIFYCEAKTCSNCDSVAELCLQVFTCESSGCVATQCSDGTEITFEENQPLQVINTCANVPVQLCAFPSGAPGTTRFSVKWFDGETLLQDDFVTPGDVDTLTFTSATGGPHMIDVHVFTGVNGEDCDVDVKFVINVQPAVSIEACPSTVACPGQNATLCANAGGTGDNPPFDFAWFTGSTPMGTPFSNTSCVSVAAGTYTVQVTDANGCQNTATTTVTSAPALTLEFVRNQTVCSGATATFMAAVNPNNPGVPFDTNLYLYNWTVMPPSGPAFTSNCQTLAICDAIAGTYTIDLTVTDACGQTATQNSIMLIVNPTPASSPIEVDVCSGNPITLKAPTTGTLIENDWTLPDGTSIKNANSISATMPGDYTLTTKEIFVNGTSTETCTSMESVNLQITDCPCVCITKCSNPTSVQPGQNFKYVLEVINAGNAPISNLVIEDTLPACVKFITADVPNNDWMVTAVTSPITGLTTITAVYTGTGIAPCSKSKIRLRVQAMSSCMPGMLTNTATVMSTATPAQIQPASGSATTTIVS